MKLRRRSERAFLFDSVSAADFALDLSQFELSFEN